jgi:Zincin-like metallopeptidase
MGMAVKLKDLKTIEYKLKHLPDGAKIEYFNDETFLLRAISTACYVPQLDTIYINKKTQSLSKADYMAYLFVLLHETIHATSHPKRLNREYMNYYPFDSRRSVYQYLKEQFENFTITPEEYNKDYDHKVSLKYYKEEIFADKVALKVFKKLSIPVHYHAVRRKVDVAEHRRSLRKKCKDYDVYKKHLADINKKVDPAVMYILGLLVVEKTN